MSQLFFLGTSQDATSAACATSPLRNPFQLATLAIPVSLVASLTVSDFLSSASGFLFM